MVEYALGIDVGTSYTAAVIAQISDGQVGATESLSLGSVGDTIPTAIYLPGDGTEIVGDAANRRGLTDPTHVSREFKRRLGDPQPIMIGGAPYSAQALMAKMLRHVTEIATRRMGEGPTYVAATHPANWGPYKLELFEQALQLADLDGAALISEPHAAAVSYASRERIADGSIVAVYDLGGGTFDAAVLRKTGGLFERLGASVGVEHLGGIDFDHALITHVVRELGDDWPEDSINDEVMLPALANLRKSLITAKELLSTEDQATIPVLLPQLQAEVHITRAQFEDSIRHRVGESLHALDKAIAGSGVGLSEIDAVVMVGGSSRIPLVQQQVAASVGRPVSLDADPKFPIARGAALAAETVHGRVTSAPVQPTPSPPAQTPPAQAAPAQTPPAQQQPPAQQAPPAQTPAQPAAAATPPAEAPATPASRPINIEPAAVNPPPARLVPDPEPQAPAPQVAATQPATAQPAATQQPAAQPADGVPLSAVTREPPSSDNQRKLVPALAAGAVAFVVIAGGAFALTRPSDDADDTSVLSASETQEVSSGDGDGVVISGGSTEAAEPATITLPSGAGMVEIEAGAYPVGLDQPGDYAPSAVAQLNAFHIDQHEVTNEEFAAFVAATGSSAPVDWAQGVAPAGEEQHPVDGINVEVAETYCGALNKRLPTEQEWEAAARGLGGSLYPWGDVLSDVELPSTGSYPVGSIPGNTSGSGVSDLSGGVWEWVSDPSAEIEEGKRILKGGANGLVRDAAYRLVADPGTPTIVASAGFRCAAAEVDPAAPAGVFDPDAVAILEARAESGDSAEALGAIIFSDDFTDPASGWQELKIDTQVSGYHAPDFFHLESSQPSQWVVSTRGVDFTDVSIETSVLVDNTGTEDGIFRYGLAVRADADGFLAFTVSPRTGTWAVLQATDDGTGNLVVSTVTEGRDPTIKGFGAKDTLRVDMNGNNFDFVVNGRLLTRLPAESGGGGDSGFFVETFDESKAHVHFDDFFVRELS